MTSLFGNSSLNKTHVIQINGLMISYDKKIGIEILLYDSYCTQHLTATFLWSISEIVRFEKTELAVVFMKRDSIRPNIIPNKRLSSAYKDTPEKISAT